MRKNISCIALHYRESKGFISSIALIFFIISCSIVTTYAINIKNYVETIEYLDEIQNEVIDKTKVVYAFEKLDKTKAISEFMVDDIYVEVFKNDDDYQLIYKNQEIILKVDGNRVVDIQ